MSDRTLNAVAALALGGVLALLLFLPVVAVRYRRRGRLAASDLVLLMTGAVYALSTYTLLPTPVPGEFRCRVPQSQLLGTIGLLDLPTGRAGLRGFVRDPAVLQVVLNVLLFVPLGYYVRAVLRRGVLVATLLGLALSLTIELTQRTGVWWFYDCAYRKYDVDDLLLNTLGAFLGAVVSWPLVRRRARDRPRPQRVTRGRRLVGLACDALFVVILGAAVAASWRALMFYVLETGPHRAEQFYLQVGVPALVEAAAVLLLGRTVGELVVDVRTRAARPWLTVPSRVVKLATGVGPVFALLLLDVPHQGWLIAGHLVLTVLAVLVTRDPRGLSNRLAGLRLEVARPAVASDEPLEDGQGSVLHHD